ncbi:MAG: DUF126 domain-containing protein [Thermoplasmatales archaeon]|jgi:predicted aconitase with swiveling domain/8-oxo-dGTP pyrophosphatase MutT (NUDIX family)|nr:DUF126 domain-containing protein [Thermoplasmatales archaeon]
MMIQGRPISPGRAEGEVLVIDDAFSFLGGVDASTGELKVSPGGNVAGKVLVFPSGKGSTVGSFVMYDLKVHGKAPAAVINASAETIVTTGAVISSIPMIDKVDVSLFRTGDTVKVDADNGTAEIENVTVTDSVSSVILIDGRILMLRRPDGARSYPGRWSLCAGKVEEGEDPETAAVREIMEETGIEAGKPLGRIDPILVREKSTVWRVSPFIFRADGEVPSLNSENTAYRLCSPDEVISCDRLVERTPEAVKALLDLTR